MTILKYFLMLVSGLLFLTCQHPEEVPLEKKKGRAFSQEFNLKQTNEINFGAQVLGITSFMVKDDRMYVLDGLHGKNAFVFSMDGSFIKKVGQEGSGPGEFQVAFGFAPIGDRLHLFGRKYHIFSNDGSFVKALQSPTNAIPFHLYPLDDEKMIVSGYSRYTPDYSLSVLSHDGDVLETFSPLDADYIKAFDTFFPFGGVLIKGENIIQFFNHRYELVFWGKDFKEKKRVPLHSSVYVAPDYENALNTKGHEKEKDYMASFTLFAGLFSYGDGYATVLKGYRNRELKDENEYFLLEFWDQDFVGLGRYEVPVGEEPLAVLPDQTILFSTEGDDGMKIIARKL